MPPGFHGELALGLGEDGDDSGYLLFGIGLDEAIWRQCAYSIEVTLQNGFILQRLTSTVDKGDIWEFLF